MIVPLVVAVLFATAWVDAITLAGIVCGSLMGMLTLVAYIARKVRQGVRLLDAVTEDMPKRLTALETQRTEDRDAHEAAHTEMLSAVAALGEKVDGLAGQVRTLAEQRADDHEHLQALTRDLAVPVRGHNQAA